MSMPKMPEEGKEQARPLTPAEQMDAWRTWAEPAAPSTMLDEPELHRLRERWPLAGGGDGPRDMLALEAEWLAAHPEIGRARAREAAGDEK